MISWSKVWKLWRKFGLSQANFLGGRRHFPEGQPVKTRVERKKAGIEAKISRR